jgi:uncharacterized protein YdhG (YjbR/CyaY superfamily)
MKTRFNTIDEYIKSFSPDVQAVLEKVRQTVRLAAPEAKEAISYQMPGFKLNGNLVHFAAFKKHIGFFPGMSAIDAFNHELTPYLSGKATVQFPLNKPVPYDLVKKIVTFRAKENLAKKRLKTE